MTQCLVTTFKDSTGRKYTHITRAESSQKPIVVGAGSKEETEHRYEAQVRRDVVIKAGQLFENMREYGR